MSIINQTAGAVIGLVTGIVTTIMRIPYVYYVSDRTLKEAGYRWYVRVLAFIPLGTVALACTISMILLKSFSTVYMGIRTGWKEGIIAAFKFPVCLHANSKIKRNRHLETKSLFFKWRIELAHLARAGLQEEAVAKKNLICKIQALPSPEDFIPNITPRQINKFKEKTGSLQQNSKSSEKKQPETLKEHEVINQYIDAYGLSFTTLHQGNSGNTSICPITIEYKNASGRISIHTYQFEVLIRELEQAQQENKTDILTASTQTPIKIPLDPDEAVFKDNSLHFGDSVKMYRGYYPGIEKHILTIIRESPTQLNVDGSSQESKQPLSGKPMSVADAIHKIQGLSIPEISGPPITVDAIRQFESVVKLMQTVPPEVKEINDYIERGCVLSNKRFMYITGCPITIELTDKNGKTIYTYYYPDFIPSLRDSKWSNNGDLLYAPAENVSDKIFLNLADCSSDSVGNLRFGQRVIMYRGYYQKLKEIVSSTIEKNKHLLFVPAEKNSSGARGSRLLRITPSSTVKIIASTSSNERKDPQPFREHGTTLQSPSITHERRHQCSQVDAKDKVQEKIKAILDQIQNESFPESKESPVSPETFLLSFLDRIINFLQNSHFLKKLTLTPSEKIISKAMLEILEYMDIELVRKIEKESNISREHPDFLEYLISNNDQTNKLVSLFKGTQKHLLHIQKINRVNKIYELLGLPIDDQHREPDNSKVDRDFLPMLGLTSEEITKFTDSKMLDLHCKAREKLQATGKIDPEITANFELSRYLKTSCPISKKQLSELHHEVNFEVNPIVTSPVTIVCTAPDGNRIICTYQCYAFIKKLHEDAVDPDKFTLDFVTHDPSSQLKLTINDNFEIYRGYYKKLNAAHIRQLIEPSQETPDNSPKAVRCLH